MPRPRKHHYVPVFYLKAWNRENGKLRCFTRTQPGVVESEIAPENTAYEEDLYSFEGLNEDEIASLEERFMGPAIDDKAAVALRQMLKGDVDSLSVDQRCDFTRFILSLRSRVPEVIKNIRTQGQEVLREQLETNSEEYDEVRESQDPETLTAWVEANSPHLIPNFGMKLVPGLIDSEQMGKPILNLDWRLVDVSGGSFDLMTSDRPLIMIGGQEKKQWVFCLPLNPSALFVAAKNMGALESELSSLGISELVKKANVRVVTQAHRRAYCASSGHKLEFFEKRLGRNWKEMPYAKEYGEES